ncbi:SICA antigen [Plasmodium coatneyi]|uniref:SICA antigen n=1 Tax=Plasmodium coatneyi TaxID=208452 RepID=A0A1B1E7K1_9APIC|nr:SICA antigen [Plasmodium coatneyi]ANQ11006.1 SICA antigen [Plasmodium coatneyi]
MERVEEGGPHAYTLVKERKQPKSVPTRTKNPKKQGVGRRRAGHRSVGRRMIIDIHLEVIDECQKGDLHSTNEEFFEILVQEFMGSEFIKEENVPKEQVRSSDSGFREEGFLSMVPSSDSGFREEDFVLKEDVPKEGVPKEQRLGKKTLFLKDVILWKMFLRNGFQVQVPGLGKEDFIPMDDIPKEQILKEESLPMVDVLSSVSGFGFREEDFVPKESAPE